MSELCFEPDMVIAGQTITYRAFYKDTPIENVMTDIICAHDGTWGYNCWNIGWFKTKTQLVEKYLEIVESGQTFESYEKELRHS